MQFTLKQLAYFIAAGEAGSILRAAQNIHVSQPSISNAIAHLEDVFQVQLFIRHHGLAQLVVQRLVGISVPRVEHTDAFMCRHF